MIIADLYFLEGKGMIPFQYEDAKLPILLKCNAAGLCTMTKKNQVMTISRKKEEIKDPKFLFFDTGLTETDRLKFLGVTITSTHNW
jgi:hypothetical protein